MSLSAVAKVILHLIIVASAPDRCASWPFGRTFCLPKPLEWILSAAASTHQRLQADMPSTCCDRFSGATSAMRASSNILLLLLSSVCSAAEAAALTNLPQLHEALLTGPIGRRYTSASLLPAAAVDASKQTWALGFAQTDVRGGGTASAQVTLVSADFNGGTSQVVASSLPVDGAAAASIVRDPATGLEFRMVRTASGGGGEPVTVVEIWDGEVRLARAVDASIRRLLAGRRR